MAANQISVAPMELRAKGGKFISGGQQINSVIKSANKRHQNKISYDTVF